jgi:hypothetical protein
MKTSMQCLKCKHRRLWIIDEVKQPDINSGNRAWTMAVTCKEAKAGLFKGENRVSAGSFQVVICEACGYTEWYARDLERLQDIPGARLVGAGTSDPGPYR